MATDIRGCFKFSVQLNVLAPVRLIFAVTTYAPCITRNVTAGAKGKVFV